MGVGCVWLNARVEIQDGGPRWGAHWIWPFSGSRPSGSKVENVCPGLDLTFGLVEHREQRAGSPATCGRCDPKTYSGCGVFGSPCCWCAVTSGMGADGAPSVPHCAISVRKVGGQTVGGRKSGVELLLADFVLRVFFAVSDCRGVLLAVARSVDASSLASLR